MPRQLRVEYPGAVYHLMSRGDRREDIFHDDVDRQDFIKTLAKASQKTGFEVHAFCLMRNHFHLTVETPNGNLEEGMRWLLSAYTLRLNHRRKLFGHVFSGRYKALIVDGRSPGYLKTVCDYVHLNPVWAKLLGAADRLLGEHGVAADTAEGRQEFEQRMEACRAQETDGAQWEPLRRGWCLGPEAFRQELLERMAGRLGEHHAGELWRESAQAKAERIIAEELQRLGWKEVDLQ